MAHRIPPTYAEEFLFLANTLKSGLIETYRVLVEANEPLTAAEVNKRISTVGVGSSYRQTYLNLGRLIVFGLVGKLGRYYYAKHLKSIFKKVS